MPFAEPPFTIIAVPHADVVATAARLGRTRASLPPATPRHEFCDICPLNKKSARTECAMRYIRPDMAVTRGEVLFEQYLTGRNIPYSYESESDENSRRPDYILKTEPAVHAEVKDFDFGPQERAEIDSFNKGNRVGSRGPTELFGRTRDTMAKGASSSALIKANRASSFFTMRTPPSILPHSWLVVRCSATR